MCKRALSRTAFGRTLAEINLLAVTAATVLAIRRGEDAVLTPDGKQALKQGDVLILTGTHDALDGARAHLRSRPQA
jgi:CPA2 family monovalent cation:H+ antiporter-2